MRKVLFILTLVASISILNAQTDKNTAPKKTSIVSQYLLGGEFGAQFGNYTLINIAPLIQYNNSEIFNMGTGISYTYYENKYTYHNTENKDNRHYLGTFLYTKLTPTPYLVLTAQPEMNILWKNRNIEKDTFVLSLVFGIGFQIGPVSATLKYDVVQDSYSPYGDRIFYSIGYFFKI